VKRATSPFGKITPEFFARVVSPRLGATRAEVVTGPRVGVDTALIALGLDRVMAITTDPLSVIPAIGLEASAKLACHLLASDLWTSGLAPQYASVSFALPPHMDDASFECYWNAMSETWRSLGVAVVAGHTGRYPGCDYSIIGAATVMGTGGWDNVLVPGASGDTDRIIITKGCAIEAAAVAGYLIPQEIAKRSGPEMVTRARALLDQASVVEDCRQLLAVGVRDRGISALHDATEGGVCGGLLELARACGHELHVERAKIPILPEVRAACEALGNIDPYWTLAEGALIATVRANRAAAAMQVLKARGIPAADVGVVRQGPPRVVMQEPGGGTTVIAEPQPDPYWAAYTLVSTP
jgi:hydrogenase maturation factor